MSCAIVVHGAIGSGKTNSCLSMAEAVRKEGITSGGILSIRVFQEGRLIGYDGLELSSGEVFPLARLRELAGDSDWFVFRNLRYSFSISGFKRANQILERSAETLSQSSIVFVDEFGRLEKDKRGIYSGTVKVAEALRGGGITVFTCRTEMVEILKKMVLDKTKNIIRLKPQARDKNLKLILKLTRAYYQE